MKYITLFLGIVDFTVPPAHDCLGNLKQKPLPAGIKMVLQFWNKPEVLNLDVRIDTIGGK